ncbi:hypothetical protein SynSYN20_01759 [Synechococcus sp. SYN20]|nr:hypothetical protein SynSYN20_01759 [Synechococcus sp. SYN20]
MNQWYNWHLRVINGYYPRPNWLRRAREEKQTSPLTTAHPQRTDAKHCADGPRRLTPKKRVTDLEANTGKPGGIERKPFYLPMGYALRIPKAIPTTTMTKEQIKQALKLVALLEKDLEGQANCSIYGNWLAHLIDHLSGEVIEEEC